MTDDKADDAQRLRELLDAHIKARGCTQAAFARNVEVPGGPSMLSQNLSGHRPISMEGVIAYARGFGVPIGAISPKLADKLREAASLLGSAPSPTEDHHSPEPNAITPTDKRVAELRRASEALQQLTSSHEIGEVADMLELLVLSKSRSGGRLSFVSESRLPAAPTQEPAQAARPVSGGGRS